MSILVFVLSMLLCAGAGLLVGASEARRPHLAMTAVYVSHGAGLLLGAVLARH